ncbi:MAG: 2-C-methyl-D-erythritol 2,4-cyclodiphosphate synthase [Candidatus Ornithospirochaeta sp.]
MSRDFALCLTAAGRSERFEKSGGSGKKEYCLIDGKSVVRKALDAFLPLPSLKRVVITVPKGQIQNMKESIGLIGRDIPVSFVEGGDTRTESIKNALLFLSQFQDFSLIAVHDGARPFVDRSTIERCLEAAEKYGGAIPGIRVTDAVKRSGDDSVVTESVERKNLWRVQTPQVFSAPLLINAYSSLQCGESYDDDEALFSSRGGRCALVEGSEDNIKITWAGDLEKGRKSMRIGFGNDIHRLEEGRALWLGGIKIEAKKGEVAHSDGDVLIHALIDAILGAKAMGDIGTFFPPEDKKWKDSDSKDLLRTILETTKPNIVNIDATITLEKTKLKPYIQDIRNSLSSLLSVPLSSVSVKAKTNEGLDALGKDEAVKAEVVALLE